MTLEGGGFRDNPNKKGRNGFRGFLFGHKMREGGSMSELPEDSERVEEKEVLQSCQDSLRSVLGVRRGMCS